MAMAHHFLPPMTACLSIARGRGTAMERVGIVDNRWTRTRRDTDTS
jgi:hypothetical protein